MVPVQTIKLSIHALGGQGGGVLADWLVHLGIENGYFAQATSVPGVAQRTGATIYYLEYFPEDAAPKGSQPVLSLSPVPGDVDIVVAAELMEAGRAILRGLVSKPRTTLVTSTHRVFAISEKTAMGDGRRSGEGLLNTARARSQRLVAFDMERAAEESGAQISAVLFGAVCGANVLPFSRPQFEAAIRSAGVAVDANLAGFDKGYRAAVEAGAPIAAVAASTPRAVRARSARAQRALDRVDDVAPMGARALAREGVARLLDYQDAAYAHLYLDRLEPVAAVDASADAKLTAETARYLALWMSFEDIFRVADLKTRAQRFARVRKEVRAADGQIVRIVEFMHPRFEEFCDALPASLGAWGLRSRVMRKALSPLFASGRQVRTTSLRWFLPLFALGRAKGWRRWTLRYRDEQTRIEDWLEGVVDAARRDAALALELVECQRLVKGYSDTHKRGLANFATIWSVFEAESEAGAAPADLVLRIRRLREAALADEHGTALAAALASEVRA